MADAVRAEAIHESGHAFIALKVGIEVLRVETCPWRVAATPDGYNEPLSKTHRFHLAGAEAVNIWNLKFGTAHEPGFGRPELSWSDAWREEQVISMVRNLGERNNYVDKIKRDARDEVRSLLEEGWQQFEQLVRAVNEAATCGASVDEGAIRAALTERAK